MRRSLLPLIAVIFASSAFFGRVSAADIPAPVYKATPAAVVAYSWSGFYGGIHGGYGWGSDHVDIGMNDPTGVTQLVAAAGGFPLSYSVNRDGYVAGAQIGFNYQLGRQWLVGIEADISATGIKGTANDTRGPCPICALPNTSTVTQDMDWFGTVRGRFGYTAGQWLIYGTGGLAYGHVKYNYLQTNVPFGGALVIAANGTDTQTGWTAGGGVEYGMGPWSFKAEYLYYDLGDRSFVAPNPLAPPVFGVALLPTFHNTGSIVRAGVNYRLVPVQ
jgi:outer membrane immunogenic protein